MAEVAIISDNHGYTGEDLKSHLDGVDEIWHAGDIGKLSSIEWMEAYGKVRGVYGNVDGHKIRLVYPLDSVFTYEGLKVYMTHIGGYPGRYTARVKAILQEEKPGLYICGHSHILKVMPDKKLNLLHINPGAYGHHGFHLIRTIIKLKIEDGKISDVKAIELGRRGRLKG